MEDRRPTRAHVGEVGTAYHSQDYFVSAQSRPPDFVCPHGADSIQNFEDCLVSFREHNLGLKTDSPCCKCREGFENREKFSGMKLDFDKVTPQRYTKPYKKRAKP